MQSYIDVTRIFTIGDTRDVSRETKCAHRTSLFLYIKLRYVGAKGYTVEKATSLLSETSILIRQKIPSLVTEAG